ncbi:MAG: prephenate dehydratase [Acidobacteriaceae bacterium]|nr:prephenate dehydratase [Acidobacteriaceae bacterium]
MRKRKIGFQGEIGAFSQQAARQILGDDIEVAPFQRFEDVFRALEAKQTDAAVIPIENTLHGSVHENYDHLLHYSFRIVGETNVRIVHNLIAVPGVKFRDVKKVYSHPVALNQCLDFFAQFPHIERTSFYDTAGSVRMLMQEQPKDSAAIASSVAAEIYGAHILKRSIEDDRQNFTRFFLLNGSKTVPPLDQGSKGWKTSLVFTTGNVPGSLFRCLAVFALRDLSLTKIESRPLRGKPWEYLFYVDLLGHEDDEPVQKALGHLRELTDFSRVLGTYPSGPPRARGRITDKPASRAGRP